MIANHEQLGELPELSSTYMLSDEQVGQYQASGNILLRHVCSPTEIDVYRQAIVDATMRHNRETRPLEERDTYGKAFLQVMNLWTVDAAVKKFVYARRFAEIAARLMGVRSVRLYHDQALFKEPGGGHTPWHQDQYYWPLDTDRTVTLWMPLVDVTDVMGSMTFADSSQRDGFVPIGDEISDASEAYFDDYVKQRSYHLSGGGAMAAGDATFHSGYTLHRAPGNVTERTREVMTIIYYPAETNVNEPVNDFQRADLKTWLNSLPPGVPAAGTLNPILFP
jgi:ectoine hydroxylase-related dioxygenase (phytanoyl-CoA dioxygenase family)